MYNIFVINTSIYHEYKDLLIKHQFFKIKMVSIFHNITLSIYVKHL